MGVELKAYPEAVVGLHQEVGVVVAELPKMLDREEEEVVEEVDLQREVVVEGVEEVQCPPVEVVVEEWRRPL